MAIHKLKLASFILLEDDYNQNVLPLLIELVQSDNIINMFCYEQPTSLWQNVLKNKNVNYYTRLNLEDSPLLNFKDKSTVIIDSINQMAISLGWDKCFRYLRKLHYDPKISRLVVILHKDCLLSASKMQIHLNHVANAIVSYDVSNPSKIYVQIKKGGKIFKSEEILTYDFNNGFLNSKPIVKSGIKEDVVERVNPGDLSTFKIEVDQLSQLAKNQLKLPYMSKIHEGQGKVYYEPDAVDDWDDEDPDDDLDI